MSSILCDVVRQIAIPVPMGAALLAMRPGHYCCGNLRQPIPASCLVAPVLLPFCRMTHLPNGLDARLKKRSNSRKKPLGLDCTGGHAIDKATLQQHKDQHDR
jgi:hypothetical protein